MRAVHHALFEDLASLAGEKNVLDDAETLSAYSRDKSPFPEIAPGIVVRPGTVGEVSAVLRLANTKRSPVIARGGGFSLTGFPQSEPGSSIILDSRRLNRVLEIDEVNMTVTAECGIIMNDLATQVAERGFYVHTVSVPIRYTTLGGVLSGVQGGGYPLAVSVSGSNLHSLLGLKVVLPDGTVLDTNAGGANIHRERDFLRGGNAPDLTGMFVGDGGSFGVKTQATVQIFPRPSSIAAGCWDFKEFPSLWQAILKLTSLETVPYETLMVLQSEPLSLYYLSREEDEGRVKQSAQTIERVCEESGGEIAPESMQQHAVEIGIGSPDYTDIFVNVSRGLLAFIIGKKEFPEAYGRVRQFLDQEIQKGKLDDLGVSLMIYFCALPS